MAMNSYLDTSFLLKFYLIEPDSNVAVEWLQQNRRNIWISSLSNVEVITALNRDPSSVVAMRNIDAYREDLTFGLFQMLEIDAEVFMVAEELAEHSREYKLRSLDILHLATALRHSIPAIGTYDKRMASAAESLGLIVTQPRS
jgi:predicted nucleic acid-binding protein